LEGAQPAILAPDAEPIRRGRATFGSLLHGGVSERPKEHASKACDG